jgi:hypothetical protein
VEIDAFLKTGEIDKDARIHTVQFRCYLVRCVTRTEGLCAVAATPRGLIHQYRKYGATDVVMRRCRSIKELAESEGY